jgi:hypothetical protein
MELELPHWLIIGGAAFVVLGMVGLVVRRARAVDEIALTQPSEAETEPSAEAEWPRDATP